MDEREEKKSEANSGEESSGSPKKPQSGKPKKSAVPPKAAAGQAAAGKPPRRPPKPKGPQYEDLEDDPLLEALRERFGEGKVGAQVFLAQKIYTLDFEVLFDAMLFLRDRAEWDYDYLVDLTVLDYLGLEEKRFCMVYHLYSYQNASLIRVKSRVRGDEVVPSVVQIWKTADWMEREVYDMFGVEFSGHPGLKRILLPEDWTGFPLRKDYDIKLQDQAWIRKHLRIRKVPS
jgi:NADH-quinone oxidoreductase subunit C